MGIKFFGQFLLEKNIIKAEELLEAVKYQESQNLKFGEYALSKGYITKKDIDRILTEQKRTDMQFGELAVKMGILTPAQVKEILTLQSNDHILIGEALVKKGFITADALEQELALFRKDQSQYIPGDVMVPDDIENPLIVRDFVDLTQKMLRRIANIIAKADKGVIRYTEPRQNYVTILTRLQGSLTYEYIFSTSLAVSKLIASGIIGENASGEPKEVISDGVKEFCNIVCGNIVAKMAQRGKSVDVGIPEEIAFSADGYNIVKGRKAVYFNLNSTAGDITLALV